MERHFHTIEIMFWGGVGALILFNVIKMAVGPNINREGFLGDLARGAAGLVK